MWAKCYGGNDMLSNNIIHTVPFFLGLQFSTMQAISQAAKIIFYQRGELIYNSQQDEPLFIYIARGWVKLHKVSSNGEEIIIDVLNDGHYFNEQFLFNKDTDLFSAQALSALQILVLPIQILKQSLYKDQQLAINLLKESIKKQQNLMHEVEHLSLQNASQRIGCFLLRLCNQEIKKGITLHLPYDKSLLAIRLGMRPETFSRALAKLVKHCKLKIFGVTVYIPDLCKLANYVCKHCSLIFPCQNTT